MHSSKTMNFWVEFICWNSSWEWHRNQPIRYFAFQSGKVWTCCVYIASTFRGARSDACVPLKVVTGTYVMRVYSLWGESSSSFLLRASRTRTRKGTFLQKTYHQCYFNLSWCFSCHTIIQPITTYTGPSFICTHWLPRVLAGVMKHADWWITGYGHTKTCG